MITFYELDSDTIYSVSVVIPVVFPIISFLKMSRSKFTFNYTSMKYSKSEKNIVHVFI